MAADSKYFDESRITALPLVGRDEVLARFELPPQYCGVLEYFSQYTNLLAANSAEIETRGLDWTIVSNGRPLAPYVRFDRILNPWGSVGVSVAVRIEPSATIELLVRNRGYAPRPNGIDRVGGRIVGRYWYDPTYGDASRGF
jgi:hypothetical protein